MTLSGNVMQFSPVEPIDPLGAAQRVAQLGQTQAQTGLIGSQAQGAQLQNDVLKARLGALGSPGVIGGGQQPASYGELPPVTTGGGGEIIAGFAYPPDLIQSRTLAIVNGHDAGAAMKNMWDQRNARIGQLLAPVVGPNGEPPDNATWNDVVSRAYHSGLITSIEAARDIDHPELASRMMASLAPTDQQPGFKGQVALSEGTARAQTTPGTAMLPGPGGGLIPTATTQAALLGLVPPPSSYNGSPLSQAVQGHENLGGNPAQRNQSGPGGRPSSTAEGNHQWTQGTWLDAVRQYMPQLAEGKTRQQILDLRDDPNLSARMFDLRAPALAREMGATVPNGTPSNASVALAHFLGPAGARTLIQAPPNALLKDILPEAAAANPTYANRTAADIAGTFARRFGTDPFQAVPSQATQPGRGAPIQTGPEEFSEPQKTNIKRVQEYQDDLTKQASAAQQTSATLSQAQAEASRFVTGPFAPFKMGGLRLLTDVVNNVNDLLGSKVIPSPDQSVGSWEAYNKNMLNIASSAVKAMAQRVTNFEFGTFQKIMPTDQTTPVGRDMVFDQFLGLADYMQAKNQMAAKMQPATTNPSQFEAEWNRAVAPEAFIIHRMSPTVWNEFKTNAAKSPELWAKLQGWVRQAGDIERMGLYPQTSR